MLDLTCNDFVGASAKSCVAQEYDVFTVQVLDDNSDAGYRARVDAFAARYSERVRVVRRADRRGFKAGNLNHGLALAATSEPFFALADSDEVLPSDFLRRMVRRRVWEQIRGFPEIVSEDLGFSLRARERGWHRVFVEDVVRFETFTETIRTSGSGR